MKLFHRYGTGTLTEVFLDRVFQECLTYEGEMVSFFEYAFSQQYMQTKHFTIL